MNGEIMLSQLIRDWLVGSFKHWLAPIDELARARMGQGGTMHGDF